MKLLNIKILSYTAIDFCSYKYDDLILKFNIIIDINNKKI